jgi:hypothetical protein
MNYFKPASLSETQTTVKELKKASKTSNRALLVSIIAVIVAIISLFYSCRSEKFQVKEIEPLKQTNSNTDTSK